MGMSAGAGGAKGGRRRRGVPRYGAMADINMTPFIDAVSYTHLDVYKRQQYRSAVFYQSDAQRVAAEASKAKIQASGVLNGTIVTEITKGGPFYAAEDYHQDYYKKNPIRYKYYRASCGRDARVKEVWGASAH